MSKFNFKKRYGQNFLQNNNVIDKIVASINPSEKDLIVEIGPGAGAITSKLKKYNATLIAFEIDTDTKKYLDKLEDNRTHIIYKDILDTDIKEELANFEYEKLFFIGNLPYYITTPIIEHIIDSHIEFDSLTIMVQKEVADRFLAKPKTKDYGYMTVILNYWFNLEKIVDVSRKDFVPVPNVDSTVLKLTRKQEENLDYEKFKKVVRSAFEFKRKTLNNNFKNFDKTKVEKVLKEHNFTLQNRAEELDLETFIDLTKTL